VISVSKYPPITLPSEDQQNVLFIELFLNSETQEHWNEISCLGPENE